MRVYALTWSVLRSDCAREEGAWDAEPCFVRFSPGLLRTVWVIFSGTPFNLLSFFSSLGAQWSSFVFNLYLFFYLDFPGLCSFLFFVSRRDFYYGKFGGELGEKDECWCELFFCSASIPSRKFWLLLFSLPIFLFLLGTLLN